MLPTLVGYPHSPWHIQSRRLPRAQITLCAQRGGALRTNTLPLSNEQGVRYSTEHQSFKRLAYFQDSRLHEDGAYVRGSQSLPLDSSGLRDSPQHDSHPRHLELLLLQEDAPSCCFWPVHISSGITVYLSREDLSGTTACETLVVCPCIRGYIDVHSLVCEA